MEITNLNALTDLLSSVPDGTTADVIASDLEAGNFETATLVSPDGETVQVQYTGEVSEGYVSPFDTESDS